MEFSETGISEERIAALEKKVQDMDALANGLLNELLDLKKIMSTMYRPEPKSRGKTVVQVSAGRETASTEPEVIPDATSDDAGSGPSMVIRPKSKSQPEAPAEPEMVRIMQSDGTMKMEPRYGDERTTDPSKRSGQMRKSTALRGKKSS
jgi:hypothetical protein